MVGGTGFSFVLDILIAVCEQLHRFRADGAMKIKEVDREHIP